MAIFYRVHRWVSIVCAVFFLLLTLTGLPLLFRGEINAWNTVNLPENHGEMPLAEIWKTLPEGMAAVTAANPDKSIRAVTPDASDGTLYFLMQGKGQGKIARAHMRMGGEQIMYDVRTGALFNRQERQYRIPALADFLHTMHILHVQMGMGDFGRDFLTVMCVIALLAIASGVYLYAPLMKNRTFGARRNGSRRALWSDWHTILSVLSATWAFLLAASGIVIVLYAAGIHDYQRTAPARAAQEIEAAGYAPMPLAPAEAIARAQATFPQKEIISMELPKEAGAPYALHLAAPPAKATNFMLGALAYLPQAADAAPVLVEPPAWTAIVPFFINLHIHNHDLLAEKIVWAAFIVLTAAMIVSGLVLYWTRFHNRTLSTPTTTKTAAKTANEKRTPENVWRAPLIFAALTVIALVLPIYGGAGDALGLLAMVAGIGYAVCTLRA